MRLSREQQAALAQRARRLGSVVPRCTELVGGYAGGVAIVIREPFPLWDEVTGAAAGFVIVLSYLVVLLRGSKGSAETGIRDWSRRLLDQVPGWRRIDDVTLRGCDADHVIATAAALLVVVTKWRIGLRDEQARRRHQRDLDLAAAAARRVRRLTSLPPNALDVPVHAVLLLWGPGNGQVALGWDDAMGVHVLDANQPWAWPQELTAPDTGPFDVRPADIDEALRKVRGWAANHQRRLSARRLAMLLLGEVRRGMGDRQGPTSRRDTRTLKRTLVHHHH